MLQKNKYLFVNMPIGDKELAKELDKKAKSLQLSRAAICRMALIEYLSKEAKREKVPA